MAAKAKQLLDRDSFRSTVFERDGNRCVICGRGPQDGLRIDAHHIIERRLFTDPHQFGGYFVDNGATLCDDGTLGSCHLKAEATLISPEQIRTAASIEQVILPDGIYTDLPLDKWGNSIESDGMRMRGPLFFDESVQKVLAAGDVLKLFTFKVRHFRTRHFPFSPYVQAGRIAEGDDRVLFDLSRFQGARVIATAKMDGSQATVYRDYMHARTPDFKSDPTWHWLQNFVTRFQYEIPACWRLNMENLWGAVTTDIQYSHLPQYAVAWMLWNDRNECLPWDETVEWVSLFDQIVKDTGDPRGLPMPKVLYDGPFDEAAIQAALSPSLDGDPLEGLVVRAADGFMFRDSDLHVGKMVRATHRVRHNGVFRRNHLNEKTRSS